MTAQPVPKMAQPTTTWGSVDLDAVLCGRWTPPQPTVGRLRDGHGLLYPARRHDVYSESEAGKTWLALVVAVHEMTIAKRNVVFLDFEDDAGGIVHRLLDMGTSADVVRERFHYVRPEEPVTALGAKAEIAQVVHDTQPSLVILDGKTEAMSLHGLKIIDNNDVAAFGTLLERPIANLGPAVLVLDHVTKDRENRGRYGIGGVHKLNGLNGAAFILENRAPFGHGLTGRSTLRIAKDRPGQLRRHALPGGREQLHWLADLVIDSTPEGLVDAALQAPAPSDPADFRPTVLMSRVSDALEHAGQPLTGRGITDRVKGKATQIRQAVACLVDDDYIAITKGPRGADLHTLIKPFQTGDTTP